MITIRLAIGTVAAVFLAGGILRAQTAAEAEGTGEEPAAPEFGKSPDEFQVSPLVAMDLWAKEPDIVDPVAICFAPGGLCYVVEMRDYPLGIGPEKKPGGTVRLLRDTDSDGKPDKSTIFAEGLSYPTSVTCWDRGILVAAPPDILYLEDRDGDGKADEKRLILTGFKRSVTDSNFNSLIWGLDNRIHGANGGNGGSISSPQQKHAPLSLKNADFAFDPRSGVVEPTYATSGGFGLAMDAFGRRFTTHNINYLQQQIIPESLAASAPLAALEPFTTNISAQGGMARIFPIGEAQTRPNHPEQAGHFSSACGTSLLEGGHFGPELAGSVFTCDVASNVVHRDILKEDGPVFRGVRPEAEAKCEFISSRDAAFRPTGLVNGPDGALYLIDMQRDVIEHPDYIPPRMREKSDLRAGEDRGRIYRITPAKSPLPKPSGLTNPAAALESAIPWERETAHRMLACLTGDAAAAALPQVSGIAQNSAIPEGRVRALWVLDAWQKLDAAMLDAALRHQHPGVRENAVELAMRKAAAWPKETSALLLRAAADEHPRVRFLAALALSGVNDPEKIGALEKVWKKDRQSEWTRKAVVIGAGAQAPILAARVKDADTGLARAAAAFAEAPEVLDSLTFSAECLDGLAEGVRLSNRGASADKWQPVAEKIAQGLKSDTVPAFVRFVKAAGVKPPGALQKFQTQAAAVLSGKSAGDRRQATEIVAAMEDFPRLLDLLGDHETAEIQQLAVNTLAKARDPALGAAIVARWRSVKPAVRPAIVRMLVDRRSWHSALLDALEKEQIRPAELNLDLEQRRELLRWSGPETAKRAAKFFTDNEYSNRKELVDKLLADLPAEGSLREGNELYRQRCLMCHVHGRLGNPVGPDLTSVSHRSAEDLLTHIVDPNQAINPTYATCEVITQRGEKHYGILREEKPDVVILIKPLAMREVIPRKDIKSFRTIDKSLMPEGLESGMSPFDLRSLIEFLKSGN